MSARRPTKAFVVVFVAVLAATVLLSVLPSSSKDALLDSVNESSQGAYAPGDAHLPASLANTSLLSEPSRSPGRTTKRVVFLRLLGVEGSGHHGVMPFLDELLRQSGAGFFTGVNPWKQRKTHDFRSKAPEVAERLCAKVKRADKSDELRANHSLLVLTPEFKTYHWRNHPGVVGLSPFSFPFWGHATTSTDFGEIKKYAIYDLDWQARAMRACDARVEFRALLLERPFELEALSRLALNDIPDPDGKLVAQAHVASVFSEYLSRELEGLGTDPRADWTRVHYSDFDGRCEELVAALSGWLALPSPPAPAAFCAASGFRASKKDLDVWAHGGPAALRAWRKEQVRRVRAFERERRSAWSAFSPAHPERELIPQPNAPVAPAGGSD